jgi:hypothetical protein
MEADDEFLKQFFIEQKQEIADNGFSCKVRSHLPNNRLNKLANLWVLFCLACAIVLFFALNGVEIITKILSETLLSLLKQGEMNYDLKSLFIAAIVLIGLETYRICSTE